MHGIQASSLQIVNPVADLSMNALSMNCKNSGDWDHQREPPSLLGGERIDVHITLSFWSD